MKPIKDIRLYKSNTPNLDQHSMPSSFAGKKANIAVSRLAMKLHEVGFSLGEFDHVYLNFTCCLPAGDLQPAKRSIDRYYPWYRYYDVGVALEEYEHLDENLSLDWLMHRIEKVLLCCCEEENQRQQVIEGIAALHRDGEQTRILYKVKEGAKLTAKLYLRLLDSGSYAPLAEVIDQQGRSLLLVELPEAMDLLMLGEIQLSSKRLTIKPRKNSFTKGWEPMSFPFGSKK